MDGKVLPRGPRQQAVRSVCHVLGLGVSGVADRSLAAAALLWLVSYKPADGAGGLIIIEIIAVVID